VDQTGQAETQDQGREVKAPNRRYSVNEEVGPFVITVGFTQDHTGAWTVPFEAFVSARGRSGTELDEHLYNVGVAISKIMQGE
jgi:hypothetical protein